MVNEMVHKATPSCLGAAGLFQHRLLEDPPTVSSLSADDRRLTAQLTTQARRTCLNCPLMTQCLYDAVVKHDVAGYVAATTHHQRMEIRNRLGIRVEPENLDTLAGVIGRHRQVNHEEVVRLRNANPHESLETIAHRLGCSASTVKRHLRKARTEPTPQRVAHCPSTIQVLSAFAEVVAPRHGQPVRSSARQKAGQPAA